MENRSIKTLVFLSHRYFEYFNLERVVDLQQTRVVLVVAPDVDVTGLPNSEFIDQLYRVKQVYNRPARSDEFCYDDVLAVLSSEIALVGSPDKLFLHCVQEGNMLVAARLRDALQLQGAGESDLLRFRNKVLMKEIVSGHGLRVPHYTRFDFALASQNPKDYYRTLVSMLGSPFIVKPVISVACQGVYKVENDAQFCTVLQREGEHLLHYEAEEYIQGTFYHCDNIRSDQGRLFSHCAQYSCPALLLHSGVAHGSLRLNENDALRADIIAFANQVLDALHLPTGASHMELFVTPQREVVFIEVAARIPGLLMVKAYEQGLGVNMLDEELQAHMGWELRPLNKPVSPCFWSVLPKLPGVLQCYQYPDFDASTHCDIQWCVKPGDRLDYSQSNLDRSGDLFACNADEQVLVSDFKKLLSYKPLKMSSEAGVLLS